MLPVSFEQLDRLRRYVTGGKSDMLPVTFEQLDRLRRYVTGGKSDRSPTNALLVLLSLISIEPLVQSSQITLTVPAPIVLDG